jgi:hypothetical protein
MNRVFFSPEFLYEELFIKLLKLFDLFVLVQDRPQHCHDQRENMHGLDFVDHEIRILEVVSNP